MNPPFDTNEGRDSPECTAATRIAVMLAARAVAIGLVCWIAFAALG